MITTVSEVIQALKLADPNARVVYGRANGGSIEYFDIDIVSIRETGTVVVIPTDEKIPNGEI